MKKITKLFLMLICILILVLTLNGRSGNPNEDTINGSYWNSNGPFASAQRARFALTYSLAEIGKVHFSPTIAKFALPDLGFINGKYVSIFAPGVSFMVLPGYLIGRQFLISQLGAYVSISLFAFINLLLITKIAKKLGAEKIPAVLSAFIFTFATPAFSYAGNLYQHHISLFFILLVIKIFLEKRSQRRIFLIFFLSGLATIIDYPNAILLAPVLVAVFFQLFNIKTSRTHLTTSLISIFFAIILPGLTLYTYNLYAHKDPFMLSGSVPDVVKIGKNGAPTLYNEVNEHAYSPNQPKKALEFFSTRNSIVGIYTHLISPDRGIIFYAPIAIFGILGMHRLVTKEKKALLLIILFNLTLYSFWGDPWGGWSFGSRYLIPSYAILTVFMSLFLSEIDKKSIITKESFYLVAIYSLSINTLGAVTTTLIPPKVEVQFLEDFTKRVEKYTYLRNLDYLFENHSESFVFNEYLSNRIPLVYFYLIIITLLVLLFSYLFWKVLNNTKEE